MAQDTDVAAEFKALVNMGPAALRKWLATDDSRSVGMTAEGEHVTGANQPESVGHHMGERILEIHDTKKADLSEDDTAAMRKVIG